MPPEEIKPVPFYEDIHFDWGNLRNRKLIVSHAIYGADAATTANYGVFFIAPFPVFVLNFYEVHRTAGSDGSAVTLQLERLQGTEALDAGDALLATALSLKATADTVQTGVLVTAAATRLTRRLNKGDRLALKDAGTPTDVANVSVIVELQIM